MTTPCVGTDYSLIGVAGLDLHVEEVFGNIIHTSKKTMYAFVVDESG